MDQNTNLFLANLPLVLVIFSLPFSGGL